MSALSSETHHTPVVIAQNLNKSFKDFWGRTIVRAVNDLTFNIQPGEIFGLLGPNGSGKSTTLKMLLGLLRPTSGAARIFGMSPEQRVVRARLGYLPEENHIHPQLTPLEALNFYGRLFGLSAAERRRRIAQLLDMVGLRAVASRPIGGFSKGMTRRVSLAQALINDPDLVVLDEPTSGLDPLGCRQVKDLLLTLSARGKTVLLSSHLLADVEDICHNILIMFQGRSVVQGAVRDLLQDQTTCRITFPELDADTCAQVIAALQPVLGAAPVFERPQRTLEQFFLTTIHASHAASHATTTLAASASEPPAAYLRDDADAALNQKLRHLTRS